MRSNNPRHHIESKKWPFALALIILFSATDIGPVGAKAKLTSAGCELVSQAAREAQERSKKEPSTDLLTFLSKIIVPAEGDLCTVQSTITLAEDVDHVIFLNMHEHLLESGINLFQLGLNISPCFSSMAYDFKAKHFDLTRKDYACSPLSMLGVTYATAKSMASRGYSSDDILMAAEDVRHLDLGLTKDTLIAAANVNLFDPIGRELRFKAYIAYDEWLQANAVIITQLEKNVKEAKSKKGRKAAIAALDNFYQSGKDQTGVTASSNRISAMPEKVEDIYQRNEDVGKNALTGDQCSIIHSSTADIFAQQKYKLSLSQDFVDPWIDYIKQGCNVLYFYAPRLNASDVSAWAAIRGLLGANKIKIDRFIKEPVFSIQQCDRIADVSIQAVKESGGPDKLSVDFKRSLRNFLGKNLHCDGPGVIKLINDDDGKIFAFLRRALIRENIDLEKAGLQAISN